MYACNMGRTVGQPENVYVIKHGMISWYQIQEYIEEFHQLSNYILTRMSKAAYILIANIRIIITVV